MGRVLARPLLLMAGLVLAGLVLRGLPGGLDQALLDRAVVGQGLAGEAIYIAAGALLCAVGVPRQAVAFGGGYAFGAGWGAALAMAAQLLGCALTFAWARMLARDWVRRRLNGRLVRIHAFLAAHPFGMALTLRLLPAGNNAALNLLAGAAGIAAVPFFAGSAIGYVPQTVIFALLGSGVQLGHRAQLAAALTLFALSLAGGLVLLRRHRAGAAETTANAAAADAACGAARTG